MSRPAGDDERVLEALGYRQELLRRMSAFSNFAISLSIICILAGGITSFHLAIAGVGGAAIGIGWAIAILTIAFAVYTPVYSTITTVCVIFLYLSYGLPVFLGLFAYGRSWTKMGPWSLGAWYRPIALVCVAGCVLFVAIGVAPPNGKALWITGGTIALLALIWFLVERKRFQGPPVLLGN